jgi:glycosyltransferase involved in cell wall biosynthesis
VVIHVEALVDTLWSGGAELLLAEFAAVAADAGVKLTVTALKPLSGAVPAADRLRERGLEPSSVPVTSLVRPNELLRVRRHLQLVRPQIVHTHLTTADILGGLAARSLQLPCVSTLHADHWGGSPADRLRAQVGARVRRHCADTVIAVSESARAAYLAAAGDEPDHVTVIHNGIVDRARPGSGRAVRQELGMAPDDLVVTSLSRLRPEKNFEASIEALRLLRGRFTRLRLLIVGDGPEEVSVRQAAAPLGEAVIMTGHRDDVMAILDATDVLIHPSHFDAFPTALLEAMAAAVPVVATGTGGMLEIVEHDVTGILVGPPTTAVALAEALTPLLAEGERRLRLGAAGRRRFEDCHGASAWALRMRALYETVLAARRC